MAIYQLDKNVAFNAANHARLNPANVDASTTLDEGYLRATWAADLRSAKFSMPKRRGKWVVEVTRKATSTANAVGAGLSNSTFSTGTWLGADGNGVCLYSQNFGIYSSGAQQSSTPSWDDTNTSFVMALDFTGDNPVMHFVLDNESSIDTSYTWTGLDLRTTEAFLTLSGSNTDSIALNTGRLPWTNQHIDRLFPDYEKGWTDIIHSDYVYSTAAVSGDTNVLATTDSLVITEQSASINAETNVNATTDTLVISEQAATVQLNKNVSATTDSLIITEQATSIKADTSVSCTADALVITENPATITAGTNIDASTQALVISEQQASINAETNVNCTTDTLVITENPVDVSLGINVSATTDSLVITENQASVNAENNVQATTAALTITEYATTVSATVPSALIDGQSSQTISSNYGEFSLYFNGTNYYII